MNKSMSESQVIIFVTYCELVLRSKLIYQALQMFSVHSLRFPNVQVQIHVICRFHVQAKKKQAYKTLNYSINTARSQQTNNRIPSGVANDFVGLSTQHVPTYSVFAGQDEYNEAVNNIQKSSGSTEPCVGL